MNKFSKAEAAFIKRYWNIGDAELTRRVNEKFGGTRTVSSVKGYRTKNGWTKPGRGRFKPGHKSWNDGTKGVCKPNSGSFIKGSMHNRQALEPIGTVRTRQTGEIFIKIDQPNVWRHRPRIAWQIVNGPIPPGHCVRTVDGDSNNVHPDNLLLVTQAENMELNRLDYYNTPDELKRTKLLIARIRGKKNQRMKSVPVAVDVLQQATDELSDFIKRLGNEY